MSNSENTWAYPTTRRNVLRGAALVAGTTAASGLWTGFNQSAAGAEAPSARGKTAVVIGSGFGGAVAALRLGAAGIKTTVIERGKRWPINPDGTTFSTINNPDGRSAWFSDRPHINQLTRLMPIQKYPGIIDRVFGNGVDAIFGVGVGGGSLAFGAFTPQPRKQDFLRVFGSAMDYEELDRVYYPRAKKMLGTSPLPEDLLATSQFKGARAWLEYIQEYGAEAVRHDFCVDWDIVREEIAGTKPASYSIGEGPYGSNSGAKNSVDHNYLPAAEATGNVNILALHEVYEIKEIAAAGQSGEKFEVSIKRIDESGEVQETKKLIADYLFMAAGSYYTSSLLATAQAKGTLTRLPESVGKGFGTNGDFLIARALLRKDCGAAQGGPGVAVMYDDDNADGPVSISWEASPFPELLGGGNMANLIQVFTDERGTIDYNPAKGTTELNYPHAEFMNQVDQVGSRFAGQFQYRTETRYGYPAAGVPVYTRLSDFGTACTWHGLGGMVMGQACNAEGQVHGYSNLFVVDGALLPGAVGLVNPALTITAIAERCMDHFVGSRGVS
ncbi:MAG: GMC oxidoreductase [Mycobacteriaceae bacterium]